MCLLKQSSKLKAAQDIVCYKVCYLRNSHLYSFFHDFAWDLNKVYEVERAKPARSRSSIYDGYFHSYEKPESGYDLFAYANAVLVKCIIPKGTYYYKGIHQAGKWGYASKKLKIVEIVK